MTSYATIHEQPWRWVEKPCPICKVDRAAKCIDDGGAVIEEGVHYARLVTIAGGDRDDGDGRDERELVRRSLSRSHP